MQMSVREACDLQELAMSCVNSITNMAMFINKVQDPELRSIIQKHYEAHIQDYNMKAEYLSKPDETAMKLQVPELCATLESYTQTGSAPVPVAPRTDITEFDDREMATSYLLTLKRAGREYAWAAMEASNPGIRTFLEDAFRMASRHAYDVWQWMVRKGYYNLQPAPQAVMNAAGSMYKTVSVPVTMTV
jgi:spore coat protein CotF